MISMPEKNSLLPLKTPLESIYIKDDVKVYAKKENKQRTGSIKYRVAWHLIDSAERNGDLTSGKRIIEETSGNTGIGLSYIGRKKGYPVTIVVSNNGCTKEAQEMMKSFDAEVISVDGWMRERQALINDMLEKDSSYYWTRQASNPATLKSAKLLGKEILQQLPKIDYFLACIGTGATITGVGSTLKERNPEIQIIAAVPADDYNMPAVDDYRWDYPKPLFKESLLDDTITVEEKDIIETMKKLQKQGNFVGLSSAVVTSAANRFSNQIDRGNILIILPDSSDRYISLCKNRFNLDLHAKRDYPL